MTRQSATELVVLHAVRLLGFADIDSIAERAGASYAKTLGILSKAAEAGWVQSIAFADRKGWSLTDSGKAENERELREERETADPEDVVANAYSLFLPLNARFLRAITDWQIKPTVLDRFAPNDHSDQVWDGQVLQELSTLGREVAPLLARVVSVLARFEGYVERYESALNRGKNGGHDWIDKTHIDSCHRVWFQLHEDLIATLGIDRGQEA
ncbi:transcriptional regulator [Micrococcoides hystricis]|uniref:Transcriptional regulator n=1 Tax=Micrococcoides hystricis TaxID=1572761 RepID=A0ABV6PCE0_9MICC